MAETKGFYRAYDYGNTIKPGQEIKIGRSIYPERADIDLSLFITFSVEQLKAMREQSVAAEKAIFDNLCVAAKKWDTQAAQTILFDLALAYVKTPMTKHTANRWEESEYSYMGISNMVYKMDYRVYEDTKYDRGLGKSVPVAWYLTWSVFTNEPGQRRNGKIAGQDKKRFTTESDMEKYLAGRIKAHSHLFKEISPPIPQEYVSRFCVNGQLLPGYIVQGQEQAKSAPNPSIKKMLETYKKVADGLSATTRGNAPPTHERG